ncbi:arginine--tRNA ligase [Aliicoccus persicus]|uniref:Arginine--tRNA ligase n=1 Tax=Aliicoccus persicus TaxID=930138 RepID=A0A662Z3X3_9STAP|nr:arginine--tRNA ligase [Aliicoccus persicus]SEW07333.1 arginyl-tRNA synthetase [Aliicoccus persicus]
MDLKDQLRVVIKEAIIKAGITEEVPDIKVEIPKDTSNGDFSTNIAMVLTKIARSNPHDIATRVIENLDLEKGDIDSVDIAGPGFINFKMKTGSLTSIITKVLEKGENYGRTTHDVPQKILLEFVSANPTGDLTMAHGRHASFGDTLANILDAAGHNVTREYYVNDAGKQIENLARSIEARYFQALGEERDIPEDGYHGKDVITLATELVETHPELKNMDEDERIRTLRDIGVTFEMDKLKKDLEDFNVRFDNWTRETRLYEENKVEVALELLTERGHTYEEDGALWLRTTEFGDDKDRVLKKSDGSYTYLMPDIAYHFDKLNRGYDQLINLFGADHHGYVNRLKASVAALGFNPEMLEIQIMQIVRLIKDGEEVRMSKRSGKSVTMRDLMEEVGVDAARYFLAMRSSDTHFDFDLTLAQSETSDNPVYYAQYAHARICSILRKAEEENVDFNQDVNLDVIEAEAALNLLKAVAEFPNTITGAANKRAPQRLTNYIQDVASLFHKFYNAVKIMTADEDVKLAYLQLISAVRITLNNALNLVGVNAPERM